MRTKEEIIAKIDAERKEFLSFWPEVLIGYLSFKDAKQFLKKGTKAKGWIVMPQTEEAILAEMREYMNFAWKKVEDHRGLSANRSISKMEAWIWLLGKDFSVEDVPYTNYGAPKLAAICNKFGFRIPDNEAVLNMIAGRPCREGCDEGCGR